MKLKFRPYFLELAVAIILILFLLCMLYRADSNLKRMERQFKSGQVRWESDSERLRKDRNRIGQELATVVALHETTRGELVAVKAELGSTMERLQGEVKKNTQLAAVIRSRTGGVIVTPTDTVFVPVGDSLPVYQADCSDEWADIAVTATPDTVMVDYTFRNEFVFSTEKRGGFFKPKTIWATATSLNPNTETVGLSTWVVPKQKPKRLVWLGVGVGIGFGGAIYFLGSLK